MSKNQDFNARIEVLSKTVADMATRIEALTKLQMATAQSLAEVIQLPKPTQYTPRKERAPRKPMTEEQKAKLNAAREAWFKQKGYGKYAAKEKFIPTPVPKELVDTLVASAKGKKRKHA